MHTIRMPQIAGELHGRRHERVVFRELQFCWEDAAFERSSFGSHDDCFPDEEVIFVDWSGGDAFRWVDCESFVLLEESFRGD